MKTLKLLPILLIPFFLNGCYDMVELNRLAIVIGIGIDMQDDNYTVTAHVLLPAQIKSKGGQAGEGGASKQSSTVRVTKHTGKSIYDALNNLTPQASRKIYLSHLHLIVIGEDAARKGLTQLLDYFIRDNEPRPTTYLLVTKGKAEEYMYAQSGIESVPDMGSINSIRTSADSGFTHETDLNQLHRSILSKTKTHILPLAMLYDEKSFDGKSEKRVIVEGTAIFKNNTLITELDKKETRGFLFTSHNITGGSLITDNKIIFNILKSNGKVDVRQSGDTLTAKFDISALVNLAESLTPGNTVELKLFVNYEKMIEEQIKGEIELALKKSIQYKADIFRLEEHLFRENPKQWQKLSQNWDTIYDKLQTEINVKVKIQNIGQSYNTFYIK